MRYRLIVLTGLLVSLANLAFAQGLRYESYYNWNFLGAGARARAMGGAFLAVSDDGTAATWNPAGLAYNEGVLTSMNWNLVHASVDNNPAGFGEASGNFRSLGFWSFVAPITLYEHEFVGGVTYNRLQDIFYEDGIASRVEDIDTLDVSSRVRSVGGLANINMGFGTQISSKLTIGVGVNLAAGDRRDDYYHLIVAQGGRFQNAVWDTVIMNLEADVDYSGMYGNFGIMYRTDDWSLGLVYTTPWTLTEQLDFKTYNATKRDQILYAPTEAYFVTEREIEMPYSIGLGGSYRASEQLLLAVDIQYRPFADGNFSTQQTAEPTNDDRGVRSPASPMVDYPTNWLNLTQFRVGAEYMVESGYGRIPLRAGFHNVPMVSGNSTGTRNVIVDYYQRPIWDVLTYPNDADNDQDMGFGFAFGTGIHWSQVHLDIALEFENSSSTDEGSYWFSFTDNGIPPYEEVELGSYEREYKHSQTRFLLHFTGYF